MEPHIIFLISIITTFLLFFITVMIVLYFNKSKPDNDISDENQKTHNSSNENEETWQVIIRKTGPGTLGSMLGQREVQGIYVIEKSTHGNYRGYFKTMGGVKYDLDPDWIAVTLDSKDL